MASICVHQLLPTTFGQQEGEYGFWLLTVGMLG
jgi:hypothetical protein